MEANKEIDTKTSKRTEGAAAEDEKNGGISCARVADGPTSLTSFGIAEPLLMAPEKCIGEALVNEGAEGPKPHLPPVEVRMLPSAAGGLLPTDIATTAMRTIFPPLPLWSFCPTEEMNFSSSTSIQT